jgi:ribonuclease H / adenosylcobalamin/alpha-ribazole phosphatase
MADEHFTAFIDGGARGNPGPAGWGALIRDHAGEVVAELHGSIGTATNNVAEYCGLLETLRWCLSQQATRVSVKSDSLLLVQQMRGAYKVKSEGLKPLCAQARLLATRIGRVTFDHVPREQNKDADRLANKAMDEAANV